MLIDEYCDSLAIRNYQPASLYRNIRLASRFLDTVDDVASINTQIVEAYLVEQLHNGRSIKTVKNHRSAIKVFCDFLTTRGILRDNPVLRIPSMEMPEEIPVCLTDAEVQKAYVMAKREDMLCEVTLALNTGLRLQELRRLMWIDVDTERMQLTVKKAKGKRPRTVPLNHLVREQLHKQSKRYGHLQYVFPGGEVGGHVKGHWNQPAMRGVSWWTKRSVKKLQKGLETLRVLPVGRTGRGWHVFRHTFATKCIRADIDVVKLRDWMGHRKIETTLRYIHVARHYDPDIEKLTFCPVKIPA